MAAATSGVQAARDAGASQWAASELSIAEQFLSRAQSANLNQEYALAQRLAAQAEVEAELAIARANLARNRDAVTTLEQQNAELQRDLARSGAEDQP